MFFEDSFFQKEVRCGFEIPVLMKRAWAAQIEVFQVVADICERNGIACYASSGTLLGAVRHNGFIPWDDDIDLNIMREDYTRLIEILPEQLPKGFCLRGIHAKQPTGIEIVDTMYQMYVVAERPLWNRNEYMRYFHGYPFEYVGIDIFPLDYIPFDQELLEIQETLINIAYHLYWSWDVLDQAGKLESKLALFEELSGVPMPKEQRRCHLVKMMDRIASLYSENEGNCVRGLSFDGKGARKECYDEIMLVPFENTEMPVPVGYDEILTYSYGDWRKPVKGGSVHGYPYYKDMEQKLKRELAEAGSLDSVDEFCEKVLRGEIVCV